MKASLIRFACLFALATMMSLSVADFVSAQQSRPAISPWLSMFNNNRGGILDNYHTFVAPQMQIQKEFAQQEQQMQRQQIEQKNMSGKIEKVLNAPKKRASFSPATGAGYRQYLHYYDTKALPQGGPPYQGKR